MLLFGRDVSRVSVSHPISDVAIDATFRGATELIDAFQTEVDIQEKGTSNFVSSADFAAERAIVDAIRGRFPDHAIISEESHSDRADSEHLWIIDPLDGTSNFLHSIPHFAVSIGYYHHGVGHVGVICNPITSDWYIAVKDQGAWHNGQRMRTSDAERLNQAMIAVGFHYDRGNMMVLTLETLRDLYRAEIHGMRRMGAAALDLAYVASGRFEAFFEYRLSPWDYAAGAILLSEAGGKITDCSGKPLPLGNSASVCATNGTLHPSLLERIAPHWNRLSSDASLS
jgi:myo-inositol-1(or 4)-monophosphatase